MQFKNERETNFGNKGKFSINSKKSNFLRKKEAIFHTFSVIIGRETERRKTDLRKLAMKAGNLMR